jgi:hypothetical protein
MGYSNIIDFSAVVWRLLLCNSQKRLTADEDGAYGHSAKDWPKQSARSFVKVVEWLTEKEGLQSVKVSRLTRAVAHREGIM